MNCTEANKLLNAYLDQQLDAAHSLKVEQHIKTCSKCETTYRELSALAETVKKHMTFHSAPESLKDRILKDRILIDQILIDPDSKDSSSKHRTDVTTTSRSPRLKQGIAFAASLLIGFVVVLNYQQHRDDEAIISEVLSSHIRAVSANRYVDVNSSETNTIIPWFAQKLDYSPKIFNFSAQGFELAGGRLDSFLKQTIAAVTYKADKSLINVYTWPSPELDDAPLESHNKRGYYVLYWCQNNMNYWVVSDGNSRQVDQLAGMIRERLSNSK